MKKCFKLGLKLWSTNIQYRKEAVKLYHDGLISYIELYTLPSSFNDFIHYWDDLDVPFIIHASHYSHGLNLADQLKVNENRVLINEARLFCDKLKSDKLIIHPGVKGTIEETARQILLYDEKRFVVENKPLFGLHNEKCRGYNKEEINFIIDETGSKFCLDVGHAICAANALKNDPISYLNDLNSLNPVMYHLSDGEYSSIYDSHKHFENGNYPLKQICKTIVLHTVTIETEKLFESTLTDFYNDLENMKNYIADQ